MSHMLQLILCNVAYHNLFPSHCRITSAFSEIFVRVFKLFSLEFYLERLKSNLKNLAPSAERSYKPIIEYMKPFKTY